jgi:hypothetical protein
LIEKLDNYYNGELSKFNLEKEKIRKKQLKRKKRIKEKYGDKVAMNKKITEDFEDEINNIKDLNNVELDKK